MVLVGRDDYVQALPIASRVPHLAVENCRIQRWSSSIDGAARTHVLLSTPRTRIPPPQVSEAVRLALAREYHRTLHLFQALCEGIPKAVRAAAAPSEAEALREA